MQEPVTSTPAKAFEEKLLTIDLIDGLRREEARFELAIADQDRMATLRQEIKSYYAEAGIQVSEETIDRAIAERQAQRYAFRPPSLGPLGHALAALYIRRKPLALAGALLGAGLFAFVWFSGQQAAESNAAAEQAQACLVSALAVAGATDVPILEGLDAEGKRLRQAPDATTLDDWSQRAAQTCAFFQTPLELRITAQPDEKTGVRRDFRSDGGRKVSGYYIIADVVTPSGAPATALVTDVERNESHAVSRLGVRTSEARYEALKRDKQDDGLIADRNIASKPAGSLQWQVGGGYAAEFIVEW